MDQNQAVEFTQKALARGATPEQVAYVLAERMNAPFDVILHFVKRVAAQPVTEPAAPAAPSAPLPEESAPALPEEEIAYNVHPTASAEDSSWMVDEVEEPVTLVQGFAAPPPPPPPDAVAMLEAQDEPNLPTEEMSILPQTTAEESGEANPEGDAPAAPESSEPRSRGRMAALYQNPEIQEQVLKELKRRRNAGDIAVKLSEQHNVRWNDAQRFVEEIATRNHAQLQRKTNFILLFFSGLSLLAGLALLAIGLIALVEGMFGQPADRWSQVFGTLVGGGLLSLGGAIGLIITFRPPHN